MKCPNCIEEQECLNFCRIYDVECPNPYNPICKGFDLDDWMLIEQLTFTTSEEENAHRPNRSRRNLL